MKTITILGSTGSIGVSTLAILEVQKESFSVFALTTNNHYEKLFEQCLIHKPQHVVVVDDKARKAFTELAKSTRLSCEIHDASGLVFVASHESVDMVMSAIVGAAGLLPTLAAAKAGKKLLLANKESLVMAGSLLLEAVAESGGVLLPVDSEHNAIFQSLPSDEKIFNPKTLKRLILTASGGPFLKRSRDSLNKVTPEEACAHPTWQMGKKISIDSATMMNKALEVIEAYFLFRAPMDKIEVLIHPQSMIHSMVEYIDKSVIAELGVPDMKTPIAYCLAYPDRLLLSIASLDFTKIKALTLEASDPLQFPAVPLAYEVLKIGKDVAIYFNAANEIAVQAFLDKKIRFTDIVEIIQKVFAASNFKSINSIEDILEADRQAREMANRFIV